MKQTTLKILKRTKRWAILVIGGTVFVFGISLIVLPGPAIVVIPLGLVILGTEFVWAKNMLEKIKEKTGFKK